MDNIDNIPIKTEPPEEEANDGHIEGSSIVAQCKDEPDVPVTAVKQEGEEGKLIQDMAGTSITNTCKTEEFKLFDLYISLNNTYHCVLCDFKHRHNKYIRLHCKKFHNPIEFNDHESNSPINSKMEIATVDTTVTDHNSLKEDAWLYIVTKLKSEHTETNNFALSYRSDTLTYECGICSFKANVLETVKEHLKQHKHKDFYCCLCYYGTTQKALMYAHLKLHITIFQQKSTNDKIFQCLKCNFFAESSTELKVHYLVDHIKKLFFCTGCKQEFITLIALYMHVQYIHHCMRCIYIASNENDLKQHMKTHELYSTRKEKTLNVLESASIYKCLHCGFCTKYKSGIVTHLAKLHNNSSLNNVNDTLHHFRVGHNKSVGLKTASQSHYKCRYCSFSSLFQKEIKNHVIEIHSDKQKYWLCELCGKYFVDLRSRKKHTEKMHTEQPKYFCMHCKFSTVYYKNLELHIQRHTGEFPHLCHICGYRSRAESAMDQHIKTHSDSQLLYSCTMCDYKGRTKRRIHDHLQAHSNKRPFPCTECDYHSKTKAHLQKHIIAIHLNAKPISCELCDFKCFEKSQLKYHMIVHSVNPDKTSFQCNWCPKTFTRKRILQQHLLLHSGVKLRCRLCSFTTHLSVSLNIHESRHFESSRMFCLRCSYSSKHRGNFIGHVNRTCAKARHKSENLMYCYHCGIGSNHRSNFTKHVNGGCKIQKQKSKE